MLEIIIPDNNFIEREYIIEVLFAEFLGLEFRIIQDGAIKDYHIKWDDCELIIRDCFFNKYPENLSYLTSEALPENIAFLKNSFTLENDIPVLYGNKEFSVDNRKIVCGIDIFASSFFMLTRWEEYVNKTRDEHDRFLAKSSLAHRNNFLIRPIVNEYLEMLWKLLLQLGFKGKRKLNSYELVLTHDIDQMDWPRTYYIILGDILKRRKLSYAWKNFRHYMVNRTNPFDTFDYIMDSSEKAGLKSHFYFMSSDLGKFPDNNFYIHGKRFRQKINDIRARGHLIGFHPGFYTYRNPERWRYEKELLDKAIDGKVIEGRQHYLRFESPLTFRLWDQNDMELDSTMGYADIEGFRCGTGDVFPVFDYLERKKLKLKERPLIVMDGNLQRYSGDEALSVLRYYKNVGEKYNSKITILFHNTTFYGPDWTGYDRIYNETLGITT